MQVQPQDPQIDEPEAPKCPHWQPATFICYSPKCQPLCCSDLCVPEHLSHASQLIPLPLYAQCYTHFLQCNLAAQASTNTLLRESINKLLHLRVTLCQYIDTEIDSLKALMKGNPVPDMLAAVKLVEGCQEGRVLFGGAGEGEAEDEVGRVLGRLRRKVVELLSKKVEIVEQADENQHSKVLSGPNRQENLRVQDRGQHRQSLPTPAEHTQPDHKSEDLPQLRVPFPLDLSTYGYPSPNPASTHAPQPSLRVYKSTYEQLLSALEPLNWVLRVHVAVWDRYVGEQGKLEAVREWGRARGVGVVVEDKLGGVQHRLTECTKS